MRPPQYLVVALLACAPQFSLAQERAYEIKVCSTSESTVIDKTTFECRGVTNASKAGVDYNNRCTFIDADGHKVVGATVGTAQGWTWKFLGGTGKWEGIEGGGTGKSIAQYPRLSPTVSAGCGLAKGTYTLKK